jgi:hypothetical protein
MRLESISGWHLPGNRYLTKRLDSGRAQGKALLFWGGSRGACGRHFGADALRRIESRGDVTDIPGAIRSKLVAKANPELPWMSSISA